MDCAGLAPNALRIGVGPRGVAIIKYEMTVHSQFHDNERLAGLVVMFREQVLKLASLDQGVDVLNVRPVLSTLPGMPGRSQLDHIASHLQQIVGIKNDMVTPGSDEAYFAA